MLVYFTMLKANFQLITTLIIHSNKNDKDDNDHHQILSTTNLLVPNNIGAK